MFKAYKYYWQNTFKYKARSTRSDFWWSVLVNVIIFTILIALTIPTLGTVNAYFFINYSGAGIIGMMMMGITCLFAFANIFPSIAISIRRFRDAGISGWGILVFWLLSIILSSVDSNFFQALSLVLDIIEIVICCLPSNYINKHGWWSPNYNGDIQVPSLGHGE